MSIRLEKPILSDIASMRAIVEKEVQEGLILPRTEDEMANAIRSYLVAKDGKKIVGFCALYIYSSILAEVRSLVVKQNYRNQGIAKKLIQEILQEGRELGIKEFLVLTYQDNLFKKLGFEVIDKSSLPNHKIWADCIKCKRFPVCEEIPLLKKF